MVDFEEAFKKLGVTPSTPDNYKGAEEYARTFEKVTILKNNNIKYSIGTSIEKFTNRQASSSDFLQDNSPPIAR